MKRARRGPIDWQEVRRRLARAAEAVEGASGPAPDRVRAVLEERARLVARVPPQAPQAADVLEVVTFDLADERYALESRYIREVVRVGPVTPVPGGPDFLVGVLNLRGEVLAVLDLRRFFHVPGREVGERSRVLVLGGDRAEFGVLADAAHEVIVLRTDQVHEPPASVAGVGREYVRGVTRDALIILDGGVLLQDARLYIDQGDEAGA